MRLIDRIIFLVIAIALCALAVKSFMPEPVRADPGQIIDVNIREIGGSSMAATALKRWIRNR